MDDDKNAGWMLIVGTLISFVTMAMHPTPISCSTISRATGRAT